MAKRLRIKKSGIRSGACGGPDGEAELPPWLRQKPPVNNVIRLNDLTPGPVLK